MSDSIVTSVPDEQPAQQSGAAPLVLGGDPDDGSPVECCFAVEGSLQAPASEASTAAEVVASAGETTTCATASDEQPPALAPEASEAAVPDPVPDAAASAAPAMAAAAPAAQPDGAGEELQPSLQAAKAATPEPVLDAAASAPAAPQATATAAPAATAVALAGAAEGEFEEAQDFSKEPLEARLSNSKDLNRRCSAYTELQASMEASDNEAFALFGKHLSVCIGETLPKGQDAALSALAVYLERAPDLEASQTLPIVRKLLEHKSIDKPKMQLLVPPVIVLVAEICEGPVVLKEMMDCLSALDSAKKKTQGFFKKQVAFIIKLFYHLLADFGPQRISPTAGYITVILKYITDSDRGIREACYSVLVELTLWMKDISELIKSMEEPQKKELTKRVADVKEEEQNRGPAKRRHRSEKATTVSSNDEASGSAEVIKPFDAYDMVEAVDAVKKLPKGWCINKVFSSELKWKDKQQHLQIFSNAVDATKLVPNDLYASLVQPLQRLLKTETNIPVFAEVAKCMGLMAKGLRKEFERPARQLLPTALTRMNDKSVWKPTQPSCLIERVEQLLWSVPFEVLLEETRTYVSSKSQFVKKEAMALLIRSLDLSAVQQNCEDVAQKFFVPLVGMALPNIDDADNLVRQEAAKFLATLALKNHTSPELPPLLDKIPPHRRNFFEEEWKRQGKELGIACSLPATAASEDVDSSVQHAPQTRQPLRQPSPLRSARGGGEPESRPASPTPALRVERALAGSPSKGNKTPRGHRGSGTHTALRLQPSTQDAMPASRGAGMTTSEVVTAAPQSARQSQASQNQASQAPVSQAPASQAQASPAQIEDMAKQIEKLQAEVQALRSQQDREAQNTSRAAMGRAASSERGLAHPGRIRTLTPLRAQSTGRREDRAFDWEPEPTERRLSNYSAGASPPPAKRAAARAVPGACTVAPPGATRARSTESRLRRSPSADTISAVPRRDSHGSEAPLSFKLVLPRVPKETRQVKERTQYWGPSEIPAEFLANLKDSFRPCVDERLVHTMFSNKQEEQLSALQIWKRQVVSDFASVVEVLDMILKWLTWTLFNPNTQIWKLVLDVLNSMLSSLAAGEQQLTDREAQILLPNIVERSGHNNLAIRDGMTSVLRQSLQVYPRVRILPILLHGLTSKSKRSAACAMRAIGDALDRQVAHQLAKAQKDVSVILRMLEDKDAELRKGAVHVVASLSILLEADAFARICKSLSKDTMGVVRAAAARLPHEGQGAMSQYQDASCLDISHMPFSGAVEGPSRLRPGTPPRRTPRVSADTQHAPSVSALAAPANSRQYGRMESPRRDAAAPVRASERIQGQEAGARRLSLQLRTPKPAISRETPTSQEPTPSPAPFLRESPSPAPQPAQGQVSYREMVRRLDSCDDDTFKEICEQIVRSFLKGEAFDAVPTLAQAVLESLRANFVPGGSALRCEQTVEVLQQFCGRKEWREVADDVVLSVLRELLQKLNNSGGWKSNMRDGSELLKKLNLACVMLLTTIHRSSAYSHLLELGLSEGDHSLRKLVAKCLKKVNNNFSRSKEIEREVREALEVLHAFAQRARPVLSAGGEKAVADLQPVLEGAREVIEAVYRACPEETMLWVSKRPVASSLATDEAELLKEHSNSEEGEVAEARKRLLLQVLELKGFVTFEAKENVPSTGNVTEKR